MLSRTVRNRPRSTDSCSIWLRRWPACCPSRSGTGANESAGMRRKSCAGRILERTVCPCPRSIRALAGPGTLGLAFPSNHSYGHGFPSRAASTRTWPTRSSRILVQHAGWPGWRKANCILFMRASCLLRQNDVAEASFLQQRSTKWCERWELTIGTD